MKNAICSSLTKISRRKILAWCLGATLAASGSVVHARKRRKRRRGGRYPLKPGQFYWIGHIAPTGPAVAVVNLHTQMVQLFRNGIAIGFSSISTGKPGYRTPLGLFSVLQKKRHYRSNKYNNAPMPWMIRLTWSGIAFHGGALPGYPASHGCIRLPHKFAAKFFRVLRHDNMVQVVNNRLTSGISPMAMLAPIDPMGQALLSSYAATNGPVYWNTEIERGIKVQEGKAKLSLLVTLSQRHLYVLYRGYLLSSLQLPQLSQDIPGRGGALYKWQPGGNNYHWLAQDAYARKHHQLIAEVFTHNLEFTRRLYSVMAQGSLLLITHLPAINDIHTELLQNT